MQEEAEAKKVKELTGSPEDEAGDCKFVLMHKIQVAQENFYRILLECWCFVWVDALEI